MPAPELFPVEKVKAAADAVLEESGRVALQYTSTDGWPRLREQIAERMERKNNIHTDAAHILMTSGSQQGLDYSSRVFVNPGDVIIIESPSYLGALNAFKACQPKFVEIPTDDDGMRVSADGIKDSLIVVGILLIIGMLTASWRAGGTILFFVYYGMKLITPRMFIVLTFALCSLLSYAIGTSFGVAGTMGVIFMAIARSGGANEILTAGAVMSGIYFGDCCSPAASSMALTASLCRTDAYAHSRRLLKANLLPMALCFVIYGTLSALHPSGQVNTGLMAAIKNEYDVSWWVSIPAVIMLALPVMKVKTRLAMALSIAAAGFTAVLLQHMSLWGFLKCLVMGYSRESAGLGSILDGGGIVSMIFSRRPE